MDLHGLGLGVAKRKLPPASLLLRFGLCRLSKDVPDNVIFKCHFELFVSGWDLPSLPASTLA